jgi:hypothetical protein
MWSWIVVAVMVLLLAGMATQFMPRTDGRDRYMGLLLILSLLLGPGAFIVASLWPK